MDNRTDYTTVLTISEVERLYKKMLREQDSATILYGYMIENTKHNNIVFKIPNSVN